MTANKPIEIYEVGACGELTTRPNPEGLQILAVRDLDEMIPTVEKRLGRQLTAIQIEQERQSAPAIALKKERPKRCEAAVQTCDFRSSFSFRISQKKPGVFSTCVPWTVGELVDADEVGGVNP